MEHRVIPLDQWQVCRRHGSRGFTPYRATGLTPTEMENARDGSCHVEMSGAAEWCGSSAPQPQCPGSRISQPPPFHIVNRSSRWSRRSRGFRCWLAWTHPKTKGERNGCGTVRFHCDGHEAVLGAGVICFFFSPIGCEHTLAATAPSEPPNPTTS